MRPSKPAQTRAGRSPTPGRIPMSVVGLAEMRALVGQASPAGTDADESGGG